MYTVNNDGSRPLELVLKDHYEIDVETLDGDDPNTENKAGLYMGTP